MIRSSDSSSLRFGLLNLWCFGGRERRSKQEEVIASAGFDVLCLLEVDPADIERFAVASGFSWWRSSVSPGVAGKHLAVAIVGSSRVAPRSVVRLTADDFLQDHDGPPMYPELAAWYHERHLAVDLRCINGIEMRVGAFHAPPGTSRGPGRLGVRGRKPWFHTRIADWVGTWGSPFVFGIDANTPKRDVLAWADTEFFWPIGRAGDSGETFLVGPPETVRHRARDLWRDWLISPAATSDLEHLPPGGPLARSHLLRSGRWCRYDQMWATNDFDVLDMRYDYDISFSDHALLAATLSAGCPRVGAVPVRPTRAGDHSGVSARFTNSTNPS